MTVGEYGITDVPTQAIEAQDIIYQAGTLKAVTSAVIPTEDVDATTIKFDVVKGVVGQDDVPFDAQGDHQRLEYTTLDVDMKWSIYDYMINDSARLNSRDVKALWTDAARSASEYFAAIQDYRIITALKAGAVNTHTADAAWDADGGDPEYDIVTGVNSIMDQSNVGPGETLSVIAPSKAYGETLKLNLIKNVQQRMKDYLEGSYDEIGLNLLSFRPFRNTSGTAQLDGLGDDALVVVNGKNTGRYFRFGTAAAAARNISLVEHSRVHGRGDYYTQKMGTCCRVVWDNLQSTNTKSTRIYKIAGVKS